jgi:hypothetical protein
MAWVLVVLVSLFVSGKLIEVVIAEWTLSQKPVFEVEA